MAQLSYGGSKAMLKGYVQTIAAIFGKQAIRCNAILPGVIETPAMQAWANPAMTAAFLGLRHVPRLGQPEGSAALATCLASDEAAYINGALMRADGGVSGAVPHGQVVRGAAGRNRTPTRLVARTQCGLLRFVSDQRRGATERADRF